MLIFAPSTPTHRGELIGLEVPEGSTFTINRQLKIHEQITEETWHQGSFQKYIGNNHKSGLLCGLCLAGWVLAVYGGDYKEKCNIIKANVGMDTALWNDTLGRKFEEVIQVLKECDL